MYTQHAESIQKIQHLETMFCGFFVLLSLCSSPFCNKTILFRFRERFKRVFGCRKARGSHLFRAGGLRSLSGTTTSRQTSSSGRWDTVRTHLLSRGILGSLSGTTTSRQTSSSGRWDTVRLAYLVQAACAPSEVPPPAARLPLPAGGILLELTYSANVACPPSAVPPPTARPPLPAGEIPLELAFSAKEAYALPQRYHHQPPDLLFRQVRYR
jgi:hypothetical protein